MIYRQTSIIQEILIRRLGWNTSNKFYAENQEGGGRRKPKIKINLEI